MSAIPAGPALLTPASAHPVLDRASQQLVESRQDRQTGPLRGRALEAVRRGFSEDQIPQEALPEVEITDLDLSLADGSALPIRILRPPGRTEPLPIVLYLHGGGWIMGGRDTHDRLMRRLAIGAQAAVAFVDYPLAPEARHPLQQTRSRAGLRALAARARRLNLDPTRIAVAGDGAGAALAAHLALAAAEHDGPAIAAQVLFCPITAPALDDAAYPAFAEGVGPTPDDLRYFQDSMLGGADPADAFVLQAPLRRLAAAPPALVVTAEADIVRDQGEAYARKMLRAGAAVTTMRMGGAIHDFVVLEALRNTPASLAAIGAAVSHLRAAFATD